MVWPFPKKESAPPARHVAAVPMGRTLARFTPLQNFSDAGSEYVIGLSYNVREGNKALEQKASGWVTEGKVTWL